MKTERCWYLTAITMFNWREGDMARWYPSCKSAANGMITGFQSKRPAENDPEYGIKLRKWIFQIDIKDYFFKLILASRIQGKLYYKNYNLKFI